MWEANAVPAKLARGPAWRFVAARFALGLVRRVLYAHVPEGKIMRVRPLVACTLGALAVACSSSSSSVPPPAGPPASATRSRVALSVGSVAADATTPALVTVTVRDEEGRPVAGAPVTVAYAGGTVVPVAPTSDAQGVATFKVTAGSVETGAVVATASGTQIAQAPTLAFHGCEYGTFVNGACAPPPFVLLPPAVPASWGGVNPESFAVADLDGNGLDDVVVSDPEGGAVQVLVSYGEGKFAQRTRVVTIGGRSFGVVAADVTGDAIVDVVTMINAGQQSAALFVMPGTGDGTLQPARITPLPGYFFLAAGADLDGDGDVDLVARLPGGVGVLLNQGGGTFGPLVALSTGSTVPMPSSIAVADLNADGVPDVVAAYSAANEIEVRLGVGDGTFGAPVRSAVGISPWGVAVGDVDGDGRLDVVTANWGLTTATGFPSDVSVLLGDGDGTLGTHAEYQAGRSPDSVAVGDLDGDGLADVVTADANGASVSVLRATGGGTLAPPISYTSRGIPAVVAMAHLDAGGAADLVVLDAQAGTITGVLGRGDGTIAAPVEPPYAYLPDDVATGDVDGDGILDLVATGLAQKLTVARGRGDGSFRTSVAFDAPGDTSGFRALAVADLDGDGDADAVVVDKRTHQLSVLLADGGALAVDATYTVSGRTEAVAIGDLDGDGIPDVVVASPGLTVGAVSTISVFLGTGGGGLGPEVQLPVGGYTMGLALGDVNADGKLDAVLAGWSLVGGGFGSDLRVLLGDGAGGFAAPIVVSRAAVPAPWAGKVTVALADLDVDGNLDAVASDGTTLLLAYLGAGDGTFAAAVAHAVGFAVESVALGDVDGDGIPDAVAAGGGVMVLRGNGDGTFANGSSYRGWSSPRKAVVANLDGDAYGDVVVADWTRSALVVLLGSAAGPQGWTPVPMGSRPSDVAAADLNHDGLMDLVATSYEGSGFAVALATGPATWALPATRQIAGYPTSVSMADLNGDGHADAVVTHVSCTGTLGGSLACTSQLGVLLGAGDGTFGAETLFAAGENAKDAALGDVNGDGALDAVVPGRSAALLLLGNGDGTFAAPVELPTAPPPEALVPPWPGATPIDPPFCEAVALADVNVDGKLDVVAANASSLATAGFRIDEVAIALGNGDGTFQRHVAFPTVMPVAVLASDLDSDGDPEIVVATNGGRISLIVRSCTGTPLLFEGSMPAAGIYLRAGDLDLDGRPEIVSSDGSPNLAASRFWLHGAFASVTFALEDDVRGLALADVDGDGRADVLVATPAGVYPLLSRAP